MVNNLEKVVAFLPCRKNSERVLFKNTRPFANNMDGLLSIKLFQLIRCKEINNIILSTNDNDVIRIANKISKELNHNIIIDDRPEILALSSTSTDDLISYVPNIVDSGVVLWTHVTSPFVNEKIYSKAISSYFKNLQNSNNDSLMSVTKLKKFIWDAQEPKNYLIDLEKWPRTQTLPDWYEVNSAIFIANIQTYINENNRIGKKPFLYELNSIESIDIDEENDFLLAEQIWLNNI